VRPGLKPRLSPRLSRSGPMSQLSAGLETTPILAASNFWPRDWAFEDRKPKAPATRGISGKTGRFHRHLRTPDA